jgi:hypothetical protein
MTDKPIPSSNQGEVVYIKSCSHEVAKHKSGVNTLMQVGTLSLPKGTQDWSSAPVREPRATLSHSAILTISRPATHGKCTVFVLGRNFLGKDVPFAGAVVRKGKAFCGWRVHLRYSHGSFAGIRLKLKRGAYLFGPALPYKKPRPLLPHVLVQDALYSMSWGGGDPPGPCSTSHHRMISDDNLVIAMVFSNIYLHSTKGCTGWYSANTYHLHRVLHISLIKL